MRVPECVICVSYCRSVYDDADDEDEDDDDTKYYLSFSEYSTLQNTITSISFFFSRGNQDSRNKWVTQDPTARAEQS